MPPKRYFDDERTAKPGMLSDDLRAALNLHDDKLPMWIYKMRVLGYPPGWLQQADITNSSLQLFDDSSQAQRSITSEAQEQAFNPECFVEFPGFNAPVPKGVRDHCEILGMPPMQHFQQLKFVKQTILPPKPVPYKRIKLSSRNDTDKNNGSFSIDDDDDDDEVQIIEPSSSEKKENPIKIKVVDPEKEEGEASDSDDEIITISSSIEESNLKVQESSSTLNILTTTIEEIPQSQSPNDSILIVSPGKSESSCPSTSLSSQTESNQEKIEIDKPVEEKATINESTKEIQSQDKQPSDNLSESSEVPSTSTTPVLIKSPSIKLIAMGCPLPADIDSKKPPLEKFAVGMGELIYFENLPTSTGVFDKMRNVISKVRKKLSE